MIWTLSWPGVASYISHNNMNQPHSAAAAGGDTSYTLFQASSTPPSSYLSILNSHTNFIRVFILMLMGDFYPKWLKQFYCYVHLLHFNSRFFRQECSSAFYSHNKWVHVYAQISEQACVCIHGWGCMCQWANEWVNESNDGADISNLGRRKEESMNMHGLTKGLIFFHYS